MPLGNDSVALRRALFVPFPPSTLGIRAHFARGRQVCTLAMRSSQQPLRGRTSLVTGASRGIGRGLAVGLGELGATVYVTGRKRDGAQRSLEETARLVRAAGGTCETFAMDHSCDDAVEELFTELNTRYERDGIKLDFLVNNAYSAVDFLIQSNGINVWRKSIATPDKPDDESKPGEVWDIINRVGLRGNFVCASYAMRQFSRQNSGVMVNISSFGGLLSLFDGAYCVGKSGVDRLSAEFARESPPGITCFTFYPGIVATETMGPALLSIERQDKRISTWNTESPLFLGRALGRALADESLRKGMHGRIVVAAEIAKIVGAKDEEGKVPLSLRSWRFVGLSAVPSLIKSPLRFLIPDVYFPLSLVTRFAGVIKMW